MELMEKGFGKVFSFIHPLIGISLRNWHIYFTICGIVAHRLPADASAKTHNHYLTNTSKTISPRAGQVNCFTGKVSSEVQK